MPPKKNHAVSSKTPRQMDSAVAAAKPSESALLLAADKFKFIFDHSIVAKSFSMPSGEMTVNQAFCDILGYSLAELQNRNWQGITHPDDLEESQSINKTLLSGERDSVRMIKRYLHKSGAVVWADVSACLCRDQAGKPLAILAEIVDITEHKQAEEALLESENRFHTLIENAPVAIYISRNGSGVYANQKDLQMFGLSGVEEIIGRPETEFLAPQSKEDSRARTRLRAEGLPTPTEFETVALHPDGSQFPVQVTVDSVQLSDGPANMTFITDITERKQAQRLRRPSTRSPRRLKAPARWRNCIPGSNRASPRSCRRKISILRCTMRRKTCCTSPISRTSRMRPL